MPIQLSTGLFVCGLCGFLWMMAAAVVYFEVERAGRAAELNGNVGGVGEGKGGEEPAHGYAKSAVR